MPTGPLPGAAGHDGPTSPERRFALDGDRLGRVRQRPRRAELAAQPAQGAAIYSDQAEDDATQPNEIAGVNTLVQEERAKQKGARWDEQGDEGAVRLGH